MPDTSRFIAVTREVSASLDRCEISCIDRAPIDVALARRQHLAYCAALEACGCEVVRLSADDAHADAVFVEDVAVVLDGIAIRTRPGAASRRGEVEAVAAAIAPFRRITAIEAPGTLDGGDVLRIGRTLYVGRSARSNADGTAQLAALVAPFGHDVVPVAIDGCLHLKSAVTCVADGAVLINRAWIDDAPFAAFRSIDVDAAEPHAANALRIGARVIYPASFPATAERLHAAGIDVVPVDVSELQKAEGATTCCSVVFDARRNSTPL
jgi:dimethylargininase